MSPRPPAPRPGSSPPRRRAGHSPLLHLLLRNCKRKQEKRENKKKEFSTAFPARAGVLHFTSVTPLGGLPQGLRAPGAAVCYLQGTAWGCRHWGASGSNTGEPTKTFCQGSTAPSLQGAMDHTRARLVHAWGRSGPALLPLQSQNIPGNICETSAETSAWRWLEEGTCLALTSTH